MTKSIEFKDTPVSVYQTLNQNGQPQRRLFMTIEDLNTIPDELFEIKISQSKKPELVGKPMFRYFSYRVNENTPFSSLAPSTATLQTPVAEIKASAIEHIGKIPGAIFSLGVNMNGRFGNIKTPEGIYTLFDDQQFAQSQGKPGYYLKSGTLATVTLTHATSQNGPYYRVQLETQDTPDEIFVKSGRSKVWGSDDSSMDAPVTDAAPDPAAAAPSAGSIW